MNKKTAYGKSYGKIILIGEHAVVYGKPALAIPFLGVKMETRIEETNAEVFLDSFVYQGDLADVSKQFDGLKSLIEKVVFDLNEALFGFKITITSSIPIERGMGSSAAVAAATTRALFDYFNLELDDVLLSEYVNYSEKIVHGNPSGIDTAIVVYNKPLYFIKNEALEQYHYSLDAHLLVADTGVLGMTKIAVSNVKKLLDENPLEMSHIDDLGILAEDARLHLENNEPLLLAEVMNESQRHLKALGVSNELLDHLTHTAKNNGALASKLTGGGLGGCIISLCESEAVAKKVSDVLLREGAKQTWIMDMKHGDIDEG